ncbi:MAG: CoA transferase [Actinobacteria bacterium]|nr:CoA transferase [Actinomycetota bacterium]
MAGVLGGIRVIDLTSGISGPMATMLLSDNGADVVKVEPPGGDLTRNTETGARVWARGKRSIELDVHDAAQREKLLALIDRADVLVENFDLGVTESLGLDWETLRARNPRLVMCSITPYGRHVDFKNRPGIDALVAARTGLHWEQRGWVGTSIGRICRLPVELEGLDIPPGCFDGPDREGPLYPQSRWPSLGASFLALTGINAALRARLHTGRGQWVETSLLQGVLVSTAGGWQRPEHPEADGYMCWIFDPRGSKGHFQCADGKWIQNWVPNPSFALGVSQGDTISVDDRINKPTDDPTRIGPDYSELVVLAHYHAQMKAAYAKYPSKEWLEAAAQVGIPMQPTRRPEDALNDQALIDEGMVVTLDDPEVGPIRQVGIVYGMSKTPGQVQGPAPTVGQHTDEILAELLNPIPATPTASSGDLKAPLDGVLVLDLGLAIAGPFSNQLLSDLGATVIKVNTVYDTFWHSTHIAYTANRGKQSISINLKDPRGLAVLHELVKRADIVQHNMRYEAAIRLGVDYESLVTIKPDLIYCHSSGFDKSRAHLPGNDQTGACLAGVEYEDGGMANGGKPIWSLTSFGDTGNGFLAANAMIQAIYHRELTGEGQFLSTSILAACLLNSSYAWVDAETGEGVDRPKVDALMFGTGPRTRLYETADRWICLAVQNDEQWSAVEHSLGIDGLSVMDNDLAIETLTTSLRALTASEAFRLLDEAGVPCEIEDDQFAMRLFDDPQFRDAGLVTTVQQAQVGRFDQFGHMWTFSETPTRIAGPPLIVGHDTVDIMSEIGFAQGDIDSLLADGVVLQSTLRQERAL